VERAAAHFFFEEMHALYVKAAFAQPEGETASLTIDPFQRDR